MSFDLGGPRRLALLARAPIAQKLPGINPQLVVIVEMKLDRVLAYAVRRGRSDGWLEHRQGPRRKLGRLPRLPMRLGPLFIAQRARASIAQVRKGIVRLMAVLPLDIQTRTRA